LASSGVLPALFADTLMFRVAGRHIVSTIIGNRRFGSSGEGKLAVKDELNSLSRGLFEN